MAGISAFETFSDVSNRHKPDITGRRWTSRSPAHGKIPPRAGFAVRFKHLRALTSERGGEDFRTLFLTASQSVYAMRTKVGPRPEPYVSAKAD
jgi:hypothetical protein